MHCIHNTYTGHFPLYKCNESVAEVSGPRVFIGIIGWQHIHHYQNSDIRQLMLLLL
jgi:hypothetical protein